MDIYIIYIYNRESFFGSGRLREPLRVKSRREREVPFQKI